MRQRRRRLLVASICDVHDEYFDAFEPLQGRERPRETLKMTATRKSRLLSLFFLAF